LRLVLLVFSVSLLISACAAPAKNSAASSRETCWHHQESRTVHDLVLCYYNRVHSVGPTAYAFQGTIQMRQPSMRVYLPGSRDDRLVIGTFRDIAFSVDGNYIDSGTYVRPQLVIDKNIGNTFQLLQNCVPDCATSRTVSLAPADQSNAPDYILYPGR
jgi:hypothetical protein